jgi:hypothetical protein
MPINGKVSWCIVPFADLSLKALNQNQKTAFLHSFIVYLLAKQHSRPVLPKNQQQPMKRMSDRPAVVHRRAWKKC